MYKIDNAIIMAAGCASRFAPISYETHKALIKVKGEVLIERQIKQLKEVGINEIIVVVGYKKEQFEYLKEKFGVILVENKDYLTKNNISSLYYARKYLKNTYICSSDNYFNENPFESCYENSYYSALYSNGETSEWCFEEDSNGFINKVTVGGVNKWYMLGHAFFCKEFSEKFIDILLKIYDNPKYNNYYWENILIDNLDILKMKLKKYNDGFIYEFDSLDELREFDNEYIIDSHSKILKSIAETLNCKQCDIKNLVPLKTDSTAADGFTFDLKDSSYKYIYSTQEITQI